MHVRRTYKLSSPEPVNILTRPMGGMEEAPHPPLPPPLSHPTPLQPPRPRPRTFTPFGGTGKGSATLRATLQISKRKKTCNPLIFEGLQVGLRPPSAAPKYRKMRGLPAAPKYGESTKGDSPQRRSTGRHDYAINAFAQRHQDPNNDGHGLG